MTNLSTPLNDYDALVVVATQLEQLNDFVDSTIVHSLHTFRQVNKGFNNEITFTINDIAPGKRLVSVPSSPFLSSISFRFRFILQQV